MFEKKLYTLSALLSLSCSAYAMDGEINKDESTSSTSISIATGPSSPSSSSSSSCSTPDQESDEEVVSVPSPATSAQSSLFPHQEVESVSSPATSAQSLLFPHDKEKVTFKWSELEAAAHDTSKEDHRAQNLFRYLCYLKGEVGMLPDSERWGDTNRTYTLPLLQEELSDNPPRRFRQGGLINPLMKYGRRSEVADKISTKIGLLPTTKDALTRLSKLTEGPLYIPDTHKMREMHLRRDIFWASNTIEQERKRAAQEREALLSELERLKAENEEFKAQVQW
jgi:hypothetical protein